MGKPAAVSVDDAIYDQAARYGLSLEEYLNGSTSSYTEGDVLPDVFTKGNPFFTGTNQPRQAKFQTVKTPRPFIWQGNNGTLRSTYEKTFNAFQATRPTVGESTQEATWQGPQIRPEYQAQSNGLSLLGTPGYWQDNNQNQLFDTEFDDSIALPDIDMGQVDSLTPPAPDSSGGGEYDIGRLLEDSARHALRRTHRFF